MAWLYYCARMRRQTSYPFNFGSPMCLAHLALAFFRGPNGLLAVVGQVDFITHQLEHHPQGFGGVPIVVNNEDAARRSPDVLLG